MAVTESLSVARLIDGLMAAYLAFLATSCSTMSMIVRVNMISLPETANEPIAADPANKKRHHAEIRITHHSTAEPDVHGKYYGCITF